MPLIRTDDAPRKLRAVWLGPKGYTLLFEWTYVQWVVVIALVPIGVGLVLALCLLVGLSPFARGVFTVLWGPSLGIYLGVRLMKGVHYDEPLRFRRLVARAELNPWGRTTLPTEETWELRMPRLREFQPPTFTEPTPIEDSPAEELRTGDAPTTEPVAEDGGGDTAGITPSNPATWPPDAAASPSGDTAGITPNPVTSSTPEEH